MCINYFTLEFENTVCQRDMAKKNKNCSPVYLQSFFSLPSFVVYTSFFSLQSVIKKNWSKTYLQVEGHLSNLTYLCSLREAVYKERNTSEERGASVQQS